MNMETGEEIFWEAPETHFPQEPIFVPRPEATAEDDGILLICGFNYETAKGRNEQYLKGPQTVFSSGSKGGARDEKFFIFIQFLVKISQIIDCRPIWVILDPPLKHLILRFRMLESIKHDYIKT